MPSILSKQLSDKLLGSEWSFGYNCYEVGHSWTPSCTDAALEISLAAGLKVLPLYTLLYGFTQIGLQRRFDAAATWDSVKSIGRSSFFIFFHAYSGAALGCGMRNAFGRFYYRILVCIPALISSYMSLLIEKPARRQALAFYLLNLASEILYRMAVTKGYFKPVNHGETLLFALSLAAWYHLIKAHGFGHDPVSAIAKALIGCNEAKSRGPRKFAAIKQQQEEREDELKATEADGCCKAVVARGGGGGSGGGSGLAEQLMAQASQVAPEWLVSKHCSCPHEQLSCLRYILGPTPSRLAIGWAIQSLLNITRRPANLIAAPLDTIVQAASSRNSIRFGLFLASLVAGGRLTSCTLRRISDKECNWHPSIAGFVAGLSMLWAPRSSISMYIMWKAVEQYYLLAARQGRVYYFDFTILSIYSASAATILYTFALEPKLMRPSYMKFLDNLSDHRLHQLNRMVLDVFGTGSSIGYEDYFPDLDPKYMSNQFKELIFNWMIQPYE